MQSAFSPIPLKQGKKSEAYDWSNLRFDEPPPFSNIVDVNMNGEMFNYMAEIVFLVNYGF